MLTIVMVPTARPKNDRKRGVDLSKFWRADWLDFFAGPPTERGCREFTGAIDGQSGYGTLRVGTRRWYAHRLSMKVAYGDGAGPLATHECDNRPCINPKHIKPATYLVNNRDMKSRGRHVHGEAVNHAKLTDEKVATARDSPLPVAELAGQFGVSECAVRNAISGRSWSHVK